MLSEVCGNTPDFPRDQRLDLLPSEYLRIRLALAVEASVACAGASILLHLRSLRTLISAIFIDNPLSAQ